MTMIDLRRMAPVLVLALSLAACGAETPESERRTLSEAAPPAAGPPGAPEGGGEAAASMLPPEAQMHLDSGNAAYRAKDYRGAMAHYRAAAGVVPTEAAPWFGVGMAATALGDKALADSANEQVRRLSPAMQPGAHPIDAPAAEGAPAGGQ